MTHTLRKSFPIQRAVLVLSASLLLISLMPASGEGQVTYEPTKHSEYQAVFDDGTSSWWGGHSPPYPIEMTGVVINNPWDMLDYDEGTNPSPQWQVYIQATDVEDFGGTALYMRRFTPWGNPPTDLFPGDAWANEMDRLNYPIYVVTGTNVTDPLRRGDLIKVEAKAPGMFYNGKSNINTRHTNNPDYEFSITILERDLTLDVASIDLTKLKGSSDNFIFDETRATGCEHYQASLVHLEGLLLDNPEDWALYDPDNPLIVCQGSRTFPMVLGIDPAFLSVDAFALSSTPFSVTAILDQESSNPMTGYRLWLTNAGDLGLSMIPEPGTAILAAIGSLLMLVALRRKGFRRVA